MIWREKKKKEEGIFCTVCSNKIFLTLVFYLNKQCTEYTFRIYILLHNKKHYYTFLRDFKIVENLKFILRRLQRDHFLSSKISLGHPRRRKTVMTQINLFFYQNKRINNNINNNNNLEDIFSIDGLGTEFVSVFPLNWLIRIYYGTFKEETFGSYKVKLYLQ